jgi:hypothetical protein
VRERNAIERLLSHAYRTSYSAGRIMAGLTTVAATLNADDQGLARIAAVHLRLPDLPDRAARDAMEAIDVLIKYARDEGGGGAWNPAQHPRTGTPPNPGWFAPTGGSSDESPSARTAAILDWWELLYGQPRPELIPEGGGNIRGSGRGPGKVPPVEPEPPRVAPAPKGETRSLESILAPGGEPVGVVTRGATPDIRTVSPAEFEAIRADLLDGALPVTGPKIYDGMVFERPDGSLIGIRSRRNTERQSTFSKAQVP